MTRRTTSPSSTASGSTTSSKSSRSRSNHLDPSVASTGERSDQTEVPSLMGEVCTLDATTQPDEFAETGEIVGVMSAPDAEACAAKITADLAAANEATGALIESIADALAGRAWIALGHGSWDELCAARGWEFRPRTSTDRAELARLLRESGMSLRGIGGMLGTSTGTVRNDLSGVQNCTPATVTGTDGKTYRPRPTPAATAADIVDGDDLDDFADDLDDLEVTEWTDEEFDLLARHQNGETVVVNMHRHAALIAWATTAGVYDRIDRRSKWGNPFELPADGDRATVIANYRDHYLPNKPSLLDNIGDLRGRVLGCWCHPEPCHGDVLAAEADQ